MREKVLSLAKGEFTYDTPEVVTSVEELTFSVIAGTHKTETFVVTNIRGTKVKGFGATYDLRVDFLPFFEGTENELAVEVDAREMVPGEHITGELMIVTDCGERILPYDIEVVAPTLVDDEGAIRDYYTLQQRIESQPEHGVDLFLSPEFHDAFLYRDERGQLLYDTLIHKNTKLQSLEEFLVGMGKKDPIRFEVSKSSLSYDIDQTDIHDSIQIRVNTWGHAGIHILSTVDFIEPHTHALWTDEFERGRDILEFTIKADMISAGRHTGEIVLQSPYEERRVSIHVHHQSGATERKVRLAKKKAIAMMYRTYLAYEEKRISTTEYLDFLSKHSDIQEMSSGAYALAVKGYIAVMLKEEENVLDFLRQAETIQIPSTGSTFEEVESYILIQYVKALSSSRDEDYAELSRQLHMYYDNGYQSGILVYILTKADKRYRSMRLLEADIRDQIEAGANSPLLYSVLMRAYRQDTTLVATLDRVTVATVNYGRKQDLATKEISMAVSFLAERMSHFHPLVFSILQSLYTFFVMTDTLRAICGMLIRGEIRDQRYFSWFEKGVRRHLRLTDLFEYYMYTLDPRYAGMLPDAILSYFQYENHLNDRCKAYLFAYIVKNKQRRKDVYSDYEEQMHTFTMRQLSAHKISEDLAVLYTEFIHEDRIDEDIARELPYVMYTCRLRCDDRRMDRVIVMHMETGEETEYSLEDGQALVNIYTPDTLILFLDERGRYFCESVDYTITKLLDMDAYGLTCYRQGSRLPRLIVHLAYKAQKSAKKDEDQIRVLTDSLTYGKLRPHMREKVLLSLYDTYKNSQDKEKFRDILAAIDPATLKRERIGEVATSCILVGMYDEAQKMLLRYGATECDPKMLIKLLLIRISACDGELEPVLLKWAYLIYQKGYYDREAMIYLRRHYIGGLSTLQRLYDKCKHMPDVGVDEDINERLLAQVLFVGADATAYEDIYLEYMKNGENRMLVKAYLSQIAYDYVVDKADITEPLFVKIEKEAMYEKDTVMVLAVLRHYRHETDPATKQREFIEWNLERFANEGMIFAFMKDYIGKVKVPYEIENQVLIQYYSGTDQPVYLCKELPDGSTKMHPMRQVFPGVFIYEMTLFYGEESQCCIYEEETEEKTEMVTVRRPDTSVTVPGFFQMVNQMAEAKDKGDDTRYDTLRRQYEKDHRIAESLFTLH